MSDKNFELILNELKGLNQRIGGIENELQNLGGRLDTFEQKTEKNLNEIRIDIQKLSNNIEVQHIENMNADNQLLSEIRSIHEGMLFVNRKVADAELELNIMKRNKQ